MQTTNLDRPGDGAPPVGASRGPQGQSTITNMVQRELEEFDRRTPRRARVVTRLIFLQVALLVMTAPLAFWPRVQPGAIGLLAVGAALYAVTLARNNARRLNQSQVLLVVGSGVITAAGVVGQMSWQPDHVLAVGLASFPFILTIIEAGLLFAPERVVLTASATTSFTAILLAVALLGPESTTTSSQAYLLAVMALGLQAIAGMIAWQIAQFILGYSAEVAQGRREEFIATQFDAFRRGTETQAARLHEQVTQLIQTIVRLSARDYTARAPVMEGELRPLAEVVNGLASELVGIIQQQQFNTSDTDTLRRIAEAADAMARGDIQAVSAQPGGTMTPTGSLLHGTLITLQRARGAMQQRLGHVRDLSIDAGQRLNQVDERIVTSQAMLNDDRAIVGQLRSLEESIATSAAHLNQLIDATFVALRDLLPPEVSAQARIASMDAPLPGIVQVVPGVVTVQLETITEDTELGPDDIAPTPSPALPTGPLTDPSAQTKLRDAWRHVVDMSEEVAKQVRDTQTLMERLGIASKSMRTLDGELVGARQAIMLVRAIAQQIYTVASSTNSQPLTGTLPEVLMGTPPGGISAQSLVSGNLGTATPTRQTSRPLRPSEIGDPAQGSGQ